MASVLAEGVVKKVCEMAIQQAANEAKILCNSTEDLEWLQSKFMEINCVLSEADEESSSQKESVKNWLHRARDIAWEAEDILEEFAVDSLYARNQFCCLSSCSQLILRHKMGTRIQKVKDRLSSVVADGNQLNIVRAAVPHVDEAESSSRSHGQQFKRWSVQDSKPVGIQSKIESMVSLLENPEIPIIAVVGVGGIGKTYLLQHVYNSRKDRYEKSACLSVSQFYSISKLQRELAFQLDKDLSKEMLFLCEVEAADAIYRFVLEKRCLIVLDDVWRATRGGHLLAKLGIPTEDGSQSKILVSTRNREVVANLNAEIYEMERLTDEQSWQLFCAYGFPKFEENRAPENLEEVARKIVKKCGELPLAIKIIAASLASNALLSEWQSKLSKLEKVGNSNDLVMDILKLSYDSLPAHLKTCFAYLSFFPEDEEIECEYLIYLWKGEGFIPTGQNPWDCLHQLADLCLLELWEGGWERWELVKYCKIHDLLLDLAILISRENKCAFHVEDAFSKLHSVNTGGGRWCRLFLAKKDIDEDTISERRPVFPTLVRTLSLSCNSKIGRRIPAMLFFLNGLVKGKLSAMLFSGMRVLRVLDLSHTNITTLPASVGEMKLLKVLNLRNTKIRKMPQCVRSLKSLSYLDVSSCSQLRHRQAPKWISELRCLQHLEGPFTRLPKGMSKLESLRTLRTWTLHLSKITCMKCGVLRLEDVGKMREIEEIEFYVEDATQLKKIEEGILAPLGKMRRLKVYNKIRGMRGESGLDLPQFPERMNAMRDLEHLELDHFAVPTWICCLANLRYLYLYYCDCSNYPELQTMQNLVVLRLWGDKRCRELPRAFGKSGGFPQLRFLEISEFPELEEFPEMEDGAMAYLEELELCSCGKLNKVGEGLEGLKRLKKISLFDSGMSELREMLKEGGTYWKKIKDKNPHITIDVEDVFA
ncbi:hypothetical protein SUGI_1114350 [Cryptomeria japonica]|uniref:putative disease resistance protein At1g50180 n=1 Tax=Cryptomeria japonica TaxID=3369 RepID=UPI00241474D7|nr:putative disease resistance protein At1g50180 [Cryptomeria japonica]GLJ52386.1 hypothetical protein SUGI_1114350 [Cryptomeria japonica]